MLFNSQKSPGKWHYHFYLRDEDTEGTITLQPGKCQSGSPSPFLFVSFLSLLLYKFDEHRLYVAIVLAHGQGKSRKYYSKISILHKIQQITIQINAKIQQLQSYWVGQKVWVFLLCLMEKLEWTYWPTQYLESFMVIGLEVRNWPSQENQGKDFLSIEGMTNIKRWWWLMGRSTWGMVQVKGITWIKVDSS